MNLNLVIIFIITNTMSDYDEEIANLYQKKTQLEHILLRPQMYIGSTDTIKKDLYIYNEKTNNMERKNINFNPGFNRIFEEILLNAFDNVTRPRSETNIINVNIDKSNNIISIYNNGKGIDIVKQKDYNLYIPEMIFGELLTSSNYNDDEKRIVGGQNGLGSKLCNIFSNEFIVETVDKRKKLKCIVKWKNNMIDKEDIIIEKYTDKPFTLITFKPDLEKFGLKEIEDDMINYMKRRLYDISVISIKPITVSFNNVELPIKTFDDYVKLYINNDNFVIDEKNKKFKFAICSSNEYNSISFVNGLYTSQGGSHVDFILDIIIKEIQNHIKKKYKLDIRKPAIKDKIFIFVNSFIENPKFTSQSKECMESNYSMFGFEYNLTKTLIKKILNLDIIDDIIDQNNLKEKKKNKKNDGKKNSRVNIPKLDDANFAGKSKSSQCKLFLTEGDSAKTLAIAGMSIIGRDYYGAYPLKGKMLNVRDTTKNIINKNEEITALKKIIGLEEDKKYTSLSELRYGGIIILTDCDYDGFHCSNLIINMIYSLWPELIDLGFIYSLSTPIIKLLNKNEIIDFYSMSKFNDWKKSNNLNKYKVKYYKGLGTFEKRDAKDIFTGFNNKIVSYKSDIDIDKNINLAFNKKLADDRKKWLMNYDKDNIIENDEKMITVSDSINRSLIHFSQYNVYRAIPSLIDGLKPTQRKVLFTCLKYLKKDTEIKVAQLTGMVSQKTDYHHGEKSISEAIINMAQNYPGSNNLNLLYPSGSFGTRLMLGKDSASERYIFTYLNKLTYKIFNKKDEPLLDFINSEGLMIEPVYYIPIIPFILCNGSKGIGTGFSTTILSYNINDIVKYIKNILENKKPNIKLNPFIKGLTGKIKLISENKYKSYGVYKVNDKKKSITILDLQYGISTNDYKIFLDNIIPAKNTFTETQFLKDYKNNTTDDLINFELIFSNDEYDKLINLISEDEEKFYKKLKLVNSLTDSNMHLFNENNIITKYNTVYDIIDTFYNIRFSYYGKRKEYQLKKMKEDIDMISIKCKFIKLIIENKIKISNVTDEALTKSLIKYDLNYDYLLNMPLRSLTKKKYEELLNESKKLSDDYNKLYNSNIKDIWIEELDDLVISYNNYYNY